MTKSGSAPPPADAALGVSQPGLSRRRMLATGLALPALVSLGFGSSRTASAETKRPPRPLNSRVIQSGHSLTDPIVPELEPLVRANGAKEVLGMRMDLSTIPGSPMEWRWNNTSVPDARHDIAGYDVLVLTERVALSGTMPWHASEDFALRFFTNAWTNGNGGKGAETVLYASWVPVDSGPDTTFPHADPDKFIPFRERLDREMVSWEQICDSVNAVRPDGSPAMTMIPGPLVMAALYDAIKAGTVPGINRIEDIFFDEIHINKVGAVMIAFAHYAVIYGRDPRDLPSRIGAASAGSVATADWMKAMVWDVVSGYARSGLG